MTTKLADGKVPNPPIHQEVWVHVNDIFGSRVIIRQPKLMGQVCISYPYTLQPGSGSDPLQLERNEQIASLPRLVLRNQELETENARLRAELAILSGVPPDPAPADQPQTTGQNNQ